MKELDLIHDASSVTSTGFSFPLLLCALMEREWVFSLLWNKFSVTPRHWRECLFAYLVLHQVPIWGLMFHVLSGIPQCSYLYPGRNKIHLCLSWPGDLQMMPAFSKGYRKCFKMLWILRTIALTYSRPSECRLWSLTGMTLVQVKWMENKIFSDHFDNPQTLEPNCQLAF